MTQNILRFVIYGGHVHPGGLKWLTLKKHPFSEFSEMKERLVRRVSAAMAWVTDSYLFGENYKLL